VARTPTPEVGEYGIVSEFGSLDGWSPEDAETYLTNHPNLKRTHITDGQYRHYIFDDRSELWIKPDGEVVRLPKPIYAANGKRILGYRVNIYTGEILRSGEWHNLPRAEQEWVVI